jgi:hypothetical protein
MMTIPIFAKTKEGRRVPLDVCSGNTIRNVKQQLKRKKGLISGVNTYININFLIFFFWTYILTSGIPVELQGLEFQRSRLQDDHIVNSYGIAKDAVVDLVEGANPLQLTVKTPLGKKIV